MIRSLLLQISKRLEKWCVVLSKELVLLSNRPANNSPDLYDCIDREWKICGRLIAVLWLNDQTIEIAILLRLSGSSSTIIVWLTVWLDTKADCIGHRILASLLVCVSCDECESWIYPQNCDWESVRIVVRERVRYGLLKMNSWKTKLLFFFIYNSSTPVAPSVSD